MSKQLRYSNNNVFIYANSGNKKKIRLSYFVNSIPPSVIPVTSVDIVEKDITLDVGQKKQLSVIVLPENATDKTVTWKSSDTTKALVTTYGLVTAVSKGDVVIKATAGNISDTCSVTIQENIPVFEDGDLLASNTALLMASPTDKLKYTIEYPVQVITDTLSNKAIEQHAFHLKFSVNSLSIGKGTNYILTLPNFVTVKAEENTLMFYFPWKNGWVYVPNTDIIDGWNRVQLLSDGSIIKLIINTNEYILATKKVVNRKLASNFSTSNYYKTATFTPSSSYKFIVPVSTSVISTTQPIISRATGTDKAWYLQGSSSKLCLYDGSTTLGKTVWTANSWYWTGLEYSKDTRIYNWYLAPLGDVYSIEDVPDFTNSEFWNKEGSYTGSDIWENYDISFGYNAGSRAYWRGTIDIGNSRVWKDGELFSDGTSMLNIEPVGSIAYVDEQKISGYPYNIETGKLKLYKNIFYLKEVSAELL